MPFSQRPVHIQLPDLVLAIMAGLRSVGGKVHLVGGAVADAIKGSVPNDWDLEVYGLGPEAVALVVSEFGMKKVGKSHETWRVINGDVDVDVNLPMTCAARGELAACDPFCSPDSAGLRRDFTINALYWADGVAYDPHGCGFHDVDEEVLRLTSGELLHQDPIRYFRAMQLFARKCETVHPSTKYELAVLAQSIKLEELAKERVLGEWRKLLLKAWRPSQGLELLRETGGLKHFPELAALVGCAQHPPWHPEGDAWQHTMLVVDMMANIRDYARAGAWEGPPMSGDELEILMWGALLHDVGKPTTSVRGDDGVITSHGHDRAGAPLATAFLERLTNNGLLGTVPKLVGKHHDLAQVATNGSDKAWRRLKKAYDPAVRLEVAACLSRADWAGSARRGDRSVLDPKREHAISRAVWEKAPLLVDRHASDGPKPLVTGGDLIARGHRPGPKFKEALEAAALAQQEGETDVQKLLAVAEGVING